MLLLFVPCIYMPKACWHAFTCGLMLTSECCGWMSCDAVDVETVAHRVYPLSWFIVKTWGRALKKVHNRP